MGEGSQDPYSPLPIWGLLHRLWGWLEPGPPPEKRPTLSPRLPFGHGPVPGSLFSLGRGI